LFDPVPEEDFNEPEKEVAWYLEDQGRLLFWYRNIPKKDYAIQGWRKPRIFADFIFTDVGDRDDAYNRVFVVETKGLHLEGNPETIYKRQVFDTCNKEAKRTTMGELGMQLNTPNIEFHVIDEDEWKNRLNALFETAADGG
jgi:type III restriction enzyme